MAFVGNPEHLKILWQGVRVWNKWRRENPKVRPDLSGAELIGANLIGADLSKANLSGANLNGAELIGASLTDASLSGASLYGANLNGANLRDVFLWETMFVNTKITGVTGLEECWHSGPSTIDYRTLQKSGELPVSFLKGIGLSDYQIEYYKLEQPNLSSAEINDIIYRIYDLRAHQAVQINPLFISYSRKDNKFVDKLEPLLIDKGIRFWRDKHEMVPGPIEAQIDRGMRLQDTILLVLSEHSVNSLWVEHEVRKAIKIQREENRKCICPVALDDSWKTCNWPERIREQVEEFYVLDFSRWQDEDAFEKMFSKLLTGLDIFYR